MDLITDGIHLLEFLTLMLSIYFLRKYQSSFFYYFIAFIFFAITVELLGIIYLNKKWNSYWIYNIYTFFEFLCIIGIYYHLNKEHKSKKIIIWLSIIFYCIYFLSFYLTVLQNYTVIMLPFFTVPFMFLYLKELLNSDSIINYKKELPFWLTVGFLIYYLGSVPFFTLQYIVGLKDRILFTLLSVVVIIMHLIFIVGLIWSKPIQK